jgi:hypothetical protein
VLNHICESKKIFIKPEWLHEAVRLCLISAVEIHLLPGPLFNFFSLSPSIDDFTETDVRLAFLCTCVAVKEALILLTVNDG